MNCVIIEDRIPFFYNEQTLFGVYVCYDTESILLNRNNCGISKELVKPTSFDEPARIDMTHSDEVSIVSIFGKEDSIQLLITNDDLRVSDIIDGDLVFDSLEHIDYHNKPFLEYLQTVVNDIKYFRKKAIRKPHLKERYFTEDCTPSRYSWGYKGKNIR